MKIHNLRLPALAFALAVGLLSAPAVVFAQDASAAPTNLNCTASGGSTGQTPDPNVSASGYPDEGFDYTPPAAPADPKPQNPVVKACEGGKVQIMVGNKQQFGNRIGGIVDVRILLLVEKNVTIDFNTLERGILKFDGTDAFHFALENPYKVEKQEKDGKTLWTIDMRVQTFVPNPSVPFNIDLRYATTVVKATGKPDWKVLTTPDFQVTTSKTLDNGEQLLEGNMQPAVVATPWPIRSLKYTGIALVVLWPLVALVLLLNRLRPRRKIPANEIAWNTLSKVFSDGDKSGFGESQYRLLVDALKGYLGAGTRTREEISSMLKGDKRHDLIVSALEKCDTALYAAKHGTGELLSKSALSELIAQIKQIVPRPE